ncbi:hypothetical protein [Streptomyces sp. JJ38]|nr:hypothetical protein [Streptomyces sp. JJ38]MBW1596876.1 hypothetical protein [Streptomyces sp. JJ38]
MAAPRTPEKAARLPANPSPQFAPDPRPTLRTAPEAVVTAALSALAGPAR